VKALRLFKGLSSRSHRAAAQRRAKLQLEALEARAVFSGDCAPAIAANQIDRVFAPGTSESVMASYDDLPGSTNAGIADFSFTDTNRWSRTSTNTTTLNQGDPTIIRWSVVPDGTAIAGSNGEPAAPSNLRAFLAGIYGSNSSSSRAQDQPWFGVMQSVFDRWSAVSGVTYVYEANDDGAALGGTSNGIVGVRGDVRISGHYIDGPSNILAYNFFPTVGDMVIDTGDTFFSNTASNSLRLRNTMAHEAGHGLGLDHVTPVDGTKLMEPSLSLNFDGPQADDILAINRGYGDRLEKNGGNDTAAAATTLSGSSFTIDTISIDDDSDLDWFKFTVGAGATLNVSATPTGSTYTSNGTTFNSLAQSDLAIAVYGGNGSTLIASANVSGAGVAETINNLVLPGSGTYYVRVSGSANAAQMYRLSGSVTNVTTAAPEIQVLDGLTDIADNTGAVSLGSVQLGAAAQATFTVRNTGTANLTLGSVSLPAGFTLVQAPATTVAAGSGTSFVVALNTTTAGSFSGQISFSNNDADENPFNFTISGSVAAPAPEIAILDGTTELTDNRSTVNFGTVNVGGTATKIFTVRNNGTANLSLGALTLPSGYTLASGLGTTTLAPGATTTFTVALNTSTAGTFSGSLSLANNDADENPFNFMLAGTVQAASTTPSFSDNFNRANSTSLGSNWTETVGNVSISSQGVSNAATSISLATVNNVTAADAVLTANVSLGSGYATRDAGLVARQSGTGIGNEYWGGIRYSGGRYVAEIWRAVDGSWTRLSTTYISVNSGALRFEVVGSSLKLYVNNTLTNSVTDTTIAGAGRVGISLTNTGTRLDNFALSAPTSTLTTSATWYAPSSHSASAYLAALEYWFSHFGDD
jgi:hypothetical protein